MTTARIPHVQTTRYKIGAMLFKRGPLPRAELFTHIKAGSSTENSARMLRRAIDDGWLTEINGAIYVGAIALSHFGGDSTEESTPTYIGQVATSRASSAYESGTLSYRTNSKGNRDDIPPYSVRDGVRFATLGGRSV
jgi:hypothetical protein